MAHWWFSTSRIQKRCPNRGPSDALAVALGAVENRVIPRSGPGWEVPTAPGKKIPVQCENSCPL